MRRIFLAITLMLATTTTWAQNFCPPGTICPINSPPRVIGSDSPSAIYHQAIVRVEAGQGRVRAAGSGTLIWSDGRRGLVLTAAHVVEGHNQATATWSNGYTSPGRVVCYDRDADIAAFEVIPPADAVVLPLANDDQWPRAGQSVELCGYGGGTKHLRHWRATVQGYAKSRSGQHHTLSVATQTIGGDSGGPIIFNGRVAAVLWGGPLAGPRGPMTATHGTYFGRIRAILDGCHLLPPCKPSTKTPELVPVTPPINTPPNRALESQLAELKSELARLRKQLSQLHQKPGLAGPAGPSGKDGKDGRDGKSADVDIDIDALAEAIKKRIAGSIRIRVEPVRNKK